LNQAPGYPQAYVFTKQHVYPCPLHTTKKQSTAERADSCKFRWRRLVSTRGRGKNRPFIRQSTNKTISNLSVQRE